MGLRHFLGKGKKKPVFVSRTYHKSYPSRKLGEPVSEDDALIVRHITPAQATYALGLVTLSPAEVANIFIRYVNAPTRQVPETCNAAMAPAVVAVFAREKLPGSWPGQEECYQRTTPSRSPAPSYPRKSLSHRPPPLTYREVRATPVSQYQQTRSQSAVNRSYMHRKTSSDDVLIVHHPSPVEVYG